MSHLKLRPLAWALAAVQVALGIRVALRLARPHAPPLAPAAPAIDAGGTSVVIPVLDEAARVGACLASLARQSAPLREILVVDGGSRDETAAIVLDAARTDRRVRLLRADPVPSGWNGKAWGLACGLAAADRTSTWMLSIDADVRAGVDLVATLLRYAETERLDALSAGLRQIVDRAQALVHPAMLATLVYRQGIPGSIARDAAQAQANGQCMLLRAGVARSCGVIGEARSSRCEDVTIARLLVRRGYRVAFVDGCDLGSVAMYESLGEAWRNWPRSLPLRDRTIGDASLALSLAEVVLVQALPLWILVAARPRRWNASVLTAVNLLLMALRLGILAGTRRAYRRPGPGYWLSPLADLAVAARIVESALRPSARWRGRTLVTEAVA